MPSCQTYAPAPCPSAPLPACAPPPFDPEWAGVDDVDCLTLGLSRWPGGSIADLLPHWRSFDESEEASLALALREFLDRHRWRLWLARPLWLDGAWRCPGSMAERCGD